MSRAALQASRVQTTSRTALTAPRRQFSCPMLRFLRNTQENINLANNSVLQNLTGLTIELWIFPTGPTPFNASAMRLVIYDNGASLGYGIFLNQSNLTISARIGNGTTFIGAGGNLAAVVDKPNHVALTWDGTTIRTFVNGVQDSLTGALSVANTGNPAAPLIIGTNTVSNGNRSYWGSASEFRLSNIARYTANFTPPTQRFTSDANTVLLYHLDEGAGTVATDSGPNSLNGTIVGGPAPQWVPGCLKKPGGIQRIAA